MFSTKYGSIDTCFQRGEDADFVKVPEGIAHYLEHKMFESEEGDAFEKYAQTGASANAFTSFDNIERRKDSDDSVRSFWIYKRTEKCRRRGFYADAFRYAGSRRTSGAYVAVRSE